MELDRFETFVITVSELNRQLNRIKNREMQRFGLRASHVMPLYYLGVNEQGLTCSELVSLCREDKAAISRNLAQLSERELVSRDLREDKRAYRARFHLTEAGKQLVSEIDSCIDRALFSGGNGLTDKKRADFYDSLAIILNNLSSYLEEKD